MSSNEQEKHDELLVRKKKAKQELLPLKSGIWKTEVGMSVLERYAAIHIWGANSHKTKSPCIKNYPLLTYLTYPTHAHENMRANARERARESP